MVERYLIKTDKNGTKHYHCVGTCGRCNGRGIIPCYIPVNGGDCFECNGTGTVEWYDKEYTPEYEAKLAEQAKKRAAKKLAEAKAHAAEKNAEFFKKNGFTPDGKTYYVLGNTYDIKEELKAQGAKWDTFSNHWHMATKPEGREVIEFSVDEIYKSDEAGVYSWDNWHKFGYDDPESYQSKIEAAEATLKAQTSTSQHQGKVGDKVEITVTYKHTTSWDNNYGGYWSTGITNLHSFKDAQGNEYIWKTDKYIEADYGTILKITGTIKEHSEYKGVKQTVLTRCKITK